MNIKIKNKKFEKILDVSNYTISQFRKLVRVYTNAKYEIEYL